MATPPGQSPEVRVVLTEEDIQGAALNCDRLETYTVAALRWWLLCRGISVRTSLKKSQVIAKIHEVIEQKLEIVDVDGSYLYRKEQQLISQGLNTLPLSVPSVPIVGWEVVSAENYKEKNVPRVMPGLLYTYLAKECERLTGHGAFRALQRGYIHWASGRLSQIEVNCQHPKFCHTRCSMTLSMKSGIYHVYILLGREGELATIEKATCECAAGNSASCTHVSGLLHALVSISHKPFTATTSEMEEEEAPLPITSYACQWKAPRKRKESDARIADLTFEKHVYGRERKYQLDPIKDFDPRPPEFRGTLSAGLPDFLHKVRGKALGISVLADPTCQIWSDDDTKESSFNLPNKQQLSEWVSAFIESLKVSEGRIREIERNTQDQHRSPAWFDARRYRLTASKFGQVFRRRVDTPPDALVLSIIEPKQFVSPSTEYGKRMEATTLEKYKAYKNDEAITVCSAGFVIYEEKPYLGATPDAYVHDPNRKEPYGLVEIKCPFKYRNVTPEDACHNSDFCSTVCTQAGAKTTKLKLTHPYYSQVQGQLAITGRKWCDFVIYTHKGISVETITYDKHFWNDRLLPTLVGFYENCAAPEIVSSVHVVGMHVRDVRSM